MPGTHRGSISGTKNNVVLDGETYDCLHTLSINTVAGRYSLACDFSVPYQVEGSANTNTTITNAQKRASLGYKKETVRVDFPMKMGATAIKAGITAWLTKLDTVPIHGITPGIHDSVVTLFNAVVNEIVNPVASSSAITELTDPETPVRV